MLLVGTLVVVVTALFAAWRNRDDEQTAALRRLAFATLLAGALPSYVLMRIGAEWIASEAAVGDPTWVGIGYGVADGGLLLAIIATVLAWRATRRGAAGPGGSGRAVLALALLLIVAYAVATWAMTAKPT